MAEKLTLASMCAGGVQERIDRALAKISDNILDLNTDAKKKRVLDVKITLTPNEDDREDVSVEVQTSVKLAPETGEVIEKQPEQKTEHKVISLKAVND